MAAGRPGAWPARLGFDASPYLAAWLSTGLLLGVIGWVFVASTVGLDPPTSGGGLGDLGTVGGTLSVLGPLSRRRVLRAAGALATPGLAGCATVPRVDGNDGTRTGGGQGNGRRTTVSGDGAGGRTTSGPGTGTPGDGSPTTAGGPDYDTIRVPADHDTIQAAVEAAEPGDLVLVATGTYHEAVEVSTPEVTIRGRDRNEVVLDGESERRNGIEVTADGVAVENLTGRHYRGNAYFWDEVVGFRGSFLTAYNNGYYGVYAYESRDGRFEHSYAAGHPDAGFYLGRNRPYDAVIDDVVAEHNAIGYSGTSTGASLTVRNSVWRHNKVGVFPNTLDTADPPQRATRIVGNQVYANNNPDAPALDTYPLLGMGILLWGGSDNVVTRNRVRDHDRFGIVVQANVAEASGNQVRDNRVGGSGRADLALGRPAGEGNDFQGNAFDTSLPAGIEADASVGSAEVAEVFADLERQVEDGDFPAGDWRDQPTPGDQPSMPDPDAPPRPADRASTWEAPRAQTEGFEME